MVKYMKKRGFLSMYMVYTFLSVFILGMFTIMMVNNYKKTFLNALKNDIKTELESYHLDNGDNIGDGTVKTDEKNT